VPANDALATTTMVRWGNWDIVTNGVTWDSTEVPSGLAKYANHLPAFHALPASLYLSAKPAFFKTVTWPPIGPDVTGGEIANTGGHANRIPARKCFEDVMGGAYADTAPKTFNAASCY
jgi:hypothetical protein